MVPTTNPGDSHHIKPPLSVAAPARTSRRCAILAGQPSYLGGCKSAICCGDTPETSQTAWVYCIVIKDMLTSRSMIYLFHGETSFINFHLPHCCSEESYNLNTRSLHAHSITLPHKHWDNHSFHIIPLTNCIILITPVFTPSFS